MSYLYIYSKHSKIGVPNYIPNTAKQGKAFQTQENTGSKHNSTAHFSLECVWNVFGILFGISNYLSLERFTGGG